MLGPFDSNGQANLFPLDVKDATGGQTWEGYNYLGVGVIILVFLTLYIQIKSSINDKFRNFGNIWWIVIVSYIISLSSTITISSEVINIPAPNELIDLLSRFRASGRFFWIGGFWLITMALAVLYSMKHQKSILFIVILLTSLQFIDIYSIAKNLREYVLNTKKQSIPKILDELVSNRTGLVVLPPWQCDSQQTPGGLNGFEIFGVFAAKYHINTNSFYAARTLPEQKRYHCDYEKALAQIDHKIIYVMSAKLYLENSQKFDNNFNCSELAVHGLPILCASIIEN
jgi:hypothetical protein